MKMTEHSESMKSSREYLKGAIKTNEMFEFDDTRRDDYVVYKFTLSSIYNNKRHVENYYLTSSFMCVSTVVEIESYIKKFLDAFRQKYEGGC